MMTSIFSNIHFRFYQVTCATSYVTSNVPVKQSSRTSQHKGPYVTDKWFFHIPPFLAVWQYNLKPVWVACQRLKVRYTEKNLVNENYCFLLRTIILTRAAHASERTQQKMDISDRNSFTTIRTYYDRRGDE